MAYTVAFCKRDYSSAGIQVISASNQHQGDPYTLFEKCSGLFEVPRIGLVDLGNWAESSTPPPKDDKKLRWCLD